MHEARLMIHYLQFRLFIHLGFTLSSVPMKMPATTTDVLSDTLATKWDVIQLHFYPQLLHLLILMASPRHTVNTLAESFAQLSVEFFYLLNTSAFQSSSMDGRVPCMFHTSNMNSSKYTCT